MFVRFTPTYMLYFHRRCDSFLQNIWRTCWALEISFW
jgi:hypothetical protein